VSFAQSLLWPLSVLYSGAARFRAWTFRAGVRRAKRFDGIVISVGNLTVGGTGKTPMVCWLAARAAAEGRRVGILTRGYRGSGDSSDEVELLRKRFGQNARFGVGANRFSKGEELASAGVNCFILDDGFQHLQIDRDVDIVLIDATNPFGGGHLLPAGRLREPVSALRRADVVVITRSKHSPAIEAVVRRFSAAPVFYAQTQLEQIAAMNEVNDRRMESSGALPEKAGKYFAFCGIGNPKAFLADLERWNLRVAGSMVFRDHHHYTGRDVDAIERRAHEAGADALLCTEKDMANLGSMRPKELPLFYCRISLQIDPAEQFWRTVNDVAEKSRGRAPR
jgi:tetraacyldisaccharide 4'-kinase